MSARKTNEVVEIEGRKFVITLLPAAESLAILKELLTRTLPVDIFSMLDINGQSATSLIEKSGLGSLGKTLMSIDEFVALENRLMKTVKERLASGDEDILDPAGNYRVSNIDNNLSLYVDLLVKVVSVNYKDFFLEKLKALGILQEMEKVEDLAQSFVL